MDQSFRRIMVEHTGEAKAPDPQPEPHLPTAKKHEDEDVGENIEKEPLKTAAESAVRDTELNRTTTTATDASATTQATAAASKKTPKKWYQRLNPLRWGATPSVPAERKPSPESTAGFFSLLSFSWMSALMTVGHLIPSYMPMRPFIPSSTPVRRAHTSLGRV
ncbi:hypothetical protein IMZ48_46810 [Candidatus Bathyarchaeota archaeon]|nr:hypothetical protein [Candidatus Bathyarchaeota archaeon]